MKYSISIKDYQGYEVESIANLSKRQAIARVKKIKPNIEIGKKIFVEFFRQSDGQYGYLNPNANHELIGEAW